MRRLHDDGGRCWRGQRRVSPPPPCPPFLCVCCVVPRRHSSIRLSSLPLTAGCSYRRHPYNTRNNAPTYSQSGVEIYLDTTGGDRCWTIEVQGRAVYRMLPNALDADYASCPNFDGLWIVAELRPGAALCSCALCSLIPPFALPPPRFYPLLRRRGA